VEFLIATAFASLALSDSVISIVPPDSLASALYFLIINSYSSIYPFEYAHKNGFVIPMKCLKRELTVERSGSNSLNSNFTLFYDIFKPF